MRERGLRESERVREVESKQTQELVSRKDAER